MSAFDPSGHSNMGRAVRGMMQVVALRGRIDRFWFVAGLALAAWWGICLSSGETYHPGRYGRPGAWLTLISDPKGYWRTMNVWIGLSGWFFILSVFHSPLLSQWRERTDLRIERERARPTRRSILWKLVFYVFVPVGLVPGLFILAIRANG